MGKTQDGFGRLCERREERRGFLSTAIRFLATIASTRDGFQEGPRLVVPGRGPPSDRNGKFSNAPSSAESITVFRMSIVGRRDVVKLVLRHAARVR